MSVSLCHFEIKVTNMARAKKFYGKLFGWKFSPMGPGYALINSSKNDVGGALDLVKKVAKSGATCPYFAVKSIEDTLETATKLKAKIVTPKVQISPKHGFMAHLVDSEGNIIGLWNNR